MKFCPSCEQANPDEAIFCHRCGSPFGNEPAAAELEMDEDQLWRTFIGPSNTILFSLKKGWEWGSADRYYMEQFRSFTRDSTPRFALTWHWPAFLLDPFLWFLYRKMYMYAAVYLVGPVISFFLTGDITVGFIWRIIAGVSANYLYYWHVKDHLGRVRKEAGPFRPIPQHLLRDTGGVQPYVFVLAILLHVFVLVLLFKGPPPDSALEDQGTMPQLEDRVF